MTVPPVLIQAGAQYRALIVAASAPDAAHESRRKLFALQPGRNRQRTFFIRKLDWPQLFCE
jgi:hypothetical protein